MTRIIINGVATDVPNVYPMTGKNAGPNPGKIGKAADRRRKRKVSLPTPIAFSDFSTDTHQINGVAKTFADMWVDGTVDPIWAPNGYPKEPAVVVPGSGLGGTATGGGFDYWLLATPALKVAIGDLNEGVTAVYEGFIDQTGSRFGSMSVGIEGSVEWSQLRRSALSNHDPVPPYVSFFNYEDRREIKITNGYHRIAVTLSNAVVAVSVDGAPFQQLSHNPSAADIDLLHVFTQVGTNPARTGSGTSFMKKVTFYTPQEADILPQLSAMKPFLYEGLWAEGSLTTSRKPKITGNLMAGQTVTISTGQWLGFPDYYTVQWKRNGANIAGATAGSYTLTNADVGANITAVVSATNEQGTGVGSSDAIVPIAAPLAISDFKNNVHSIGGVSKTFAQMWGEDPTFNAFDPATIVPGVGIQVISSAQKFNSICAKAALLAALDLPSGIVAVIEYTMSTTGTARPNIGLDVLELPSYAADWYFNHRSAGVRIADYGAVYVDNTPAPQGTFKTAVGLNANELAYSISGAAPFVAPGDPQDNAGANAFALSCQINPAGTGVATAIVTKITFFDAQPSAALAALSA